MENLPNEKQLCRLNDLVIPGSHDSGTFYLNQDLEVGPDEPQMIHNLVTVFGKFAKSVVHGWSVTQSLNIYEQLYAGVRYIDLRVALRAEENDVRIVHGLYGCLVNEILRDVKRFNAERPKEVVILDFNHFYNMDSEAHQRLADTLLGMFGETLRAPGEDPLNVTLQDLWACEQSVIIVYHDYDVYECYPCFWPPNYFYSPWPNVSDRKQLMDFLSTKCLKSDCPNNAFHITQGVLTPQTSTVVGNMTGTLKDCLAVKCNIHLTGWLKALCDSKYHKFNIIITDFVEHGEFIPTVISMNYFY
ncbi:predicted protein [Nematostella vectensis]|uniref:Phosphatidylinositol-specific phospholipase C X domain-containing protein n=2 Tax=Nematostella vectensis TaxID=45351 RepID=A7RYB9_NEMVE|nr:predicted protein [Nematostella vectensis]|eukprot:XP_001635497.1 predicted protein [Nematostella vectensis]